ncbi:MAG: ABC transporter permease, partial [Bacteroidia bacterium]
MFRLFSTIQKELLILLRDRGGLIIMFIMPVAMITIMALIQDAPFRDFQEMKIPLLLINNDKGKLGNTIEKGLKESKIFEITASKLSADLVKQKVKSGDFEIGIIIPENASDFLNSKISGFVDQKLSEAGLSDSSSVSKNSPLQELNLEILFSPDTKKSFKASILSSLKQSTSKIETQTLLDLFKKELKKNGSETADDEPMGDFVNFREINTIDTPSDALKLNSVQHNVPAWTIFGMFFIVISMSGSIIKERDEGSYTRILTMPVSNITILAGKIAAYLFICLIQCTLMLMVGIYLLPHMGLPRLVIGHSIPAIVVVAVSAGLAATGYGVMIGSLFKTHQQSSTFGAVSVVILAALGGIWVPVFVMPESIRFFADFSPLYWGLSAFHKLFLNDGNIRDILPHALKLSVFFIITLCVTFFYNKK